MLDPAALALAARQVRCLRGEDSLEGEEAWQMGQALAAELREGAWHPAPADVFDIAKPGGRGFRTVARLHRRDRAVQRVALAALHRSLPRLFPRVVHSYLPGRSALGLVSWMEARLRAWGGVWAWSLDVVDFFPSLRHDDLFEGVAEVVRSPLLRMILERSITQDVRRGARVQRPTIGVLQGALLSPWLSNLYLRSVDAELPADIYRRYCDNLFLAGSRSQIEDAAETLIIETERLGLRLRARPAEPRRAHVGLECLGYHIDAAGRRPGAGAVSRFLSRVEALLRRDPLRAAALVRGFRNYFGTLPGDLTMEIDDLLRAGRFREALMRIEAERRAREEDAPPAFDDEDAETLLEAIGGDPDRHAELGPGPMRHIVHRGLGRDDLAVHRSGSRQLGVLPVDRAGFAHVGVVDLDGPDDLGATQRDRQVGTGPDAAQIVAAASRRGLPAVVESTGGRGHHVWLPFSRPLPREEAVRRLEHLARDAGPPPSGVRRELFPGEPDTDPAVRLPLGNHPRTGQPSRFVNARGEPLRGSDVVGALRAPDPEARVPKVRDPAARAVLERCALLTELALRAAATGHLNHHERYSLAAVLAPLGPGGVEAIHAIISACANYDHEVTQHFIDRISPRPMGCVRLKERHPDLAGDCACPSVGGGYDYPCPLRLAGRVRRGERPERTATDLERLIRGLGRSLRRLRGEGDGAE